VDLDERQRLFSRRTLRLSFAVGLLLGAGASGSVVGERLSLGDVRWSGAALVLVFALSVVGLALTAWPLSRSFVDMESGAEERLRPLAILAAQIAGAVCGIGLIHVILRASGPAALAWMSKSPAELVNDVTAVSGLLTAVWACSTRQLRVDWLWVMLCVLLLYRQTTPHWHLDHAPHAFQATVQQLVAAQFIAVATGLLAFRRFGAA